MIDLTPKFLELQRFKPPTVGRYKISELWGVLNAYDTPEQFIKGKIIDFESAMKMKMGTLKHKLCQECLEGWEIEKKTEFTITTLAGEDFLIVGMADAIKDDTIMEIKTSDTLIEKAKRWHEWQLKMYLGMFNQKYGIIVQPIIKKGLFLKTIGEVKENKDWFNKEINKIIELHKNLCQMRKKN